MEIDLLDPTKLQPGQIVEGYKITERLGWTVLGVTCRAEKDDRSYIIKFWLQNDDDTIDEWSRLLNDAEQRANKLMCVEHPNVLPFHSFQTVAQGRFDSREILFVVTSEVEGTSIDTWMETQPSLREFATVTAQLANALQFVHANGISHRNVRCSNIVVRSYDQHPFLVDFLMMPFGRNRPTTSRHLAPESFRGKLIHFAASDDTYSLGFALYTLLTGKTPFARQSMLSWYVRPTSPCDPREFNSSIPGEVAEVLLSLMERDPTKRMTCAALETWCRQWVETRTSSAWNEPFFIPALHGDQSSPQVTPAASPADLLTLASRNSP